MLSSDYEPRNEEEDSEYDYEYAGLDDPDNVYCVGLIANGRRCLEYGCYRVIRHKGAE